MSLCYIICHENFLGRSKCGPCEEQQGSHAVGGEGGGEMRQGGGEVSGHIGSCSAYGGLHIFLWRRREALGGI